MNDPRYIILHCSDSNFGDVALIDEWHKARGWNKIGYHYVIYNGFLSASKKQPKFDGLIQAGRAEDEIGAHCLNYNSKSIGICMIGKQIFTLNQWASLYALVQSLTERYNIYTDAILGHGEADPSSKKTCPNFNVESFRANHKIIAFDYRHVLMRLGKDL